MEDVSINKLYEYFREKAPGSYRHCEAVASICEIIANELPLDKEALVMAAKLHDIGKTAHPEAFSENQAKDENLHDNISPKESYQYISRHIGDGLVILAQHPSIPREVLGIVSQHHGNTCIRSICKRAKEMDPDVDEADFRYHSDKPTTKEAAVLMIVDVVEAATKSLYNSGQLEDIQNAVDKLIDALIDDRQLDNMRIGDVRVIKKILYKELDNIYHKRVSYGDEEELSKNNNKELDNE